MQRTQGQFFSWQYTTVRLFMCIVLRTVILCCYCVVYLSGVLPLRTNSQLSVISYTHCSHTCYIWILQTASNSGMYMVSTNIQKEIMKKISSHPHIHSRLNFSISDTKWFYVFKLLIVLLGLYCTWLENFRDILLLFIYDFKLRSYNGSVRRISMKMVSTNAEKLRSVN